MSTLNKCIYTDFIDGGVYCRRDYICEGCSIREEIGAVLADLLSGNKKMPEGKSVPTNPRK